MIKTMKTNIRPAPAEKTRATDNDRSHFNSSTESTDAKKWSTRRTGKYSTEVPDVPGPRRFTPIPYVSRSQLMDLNLLLQGHRFGQFTFRFGWSHHRMIDWYFLQWHVHDTKGKVMSLNDIPQAQAGLSIEEFPSHLVFLLFRPSLITSSSKKKSIVRFIE